MSDKKTGTTRDERKLLEDAAKIILRELAAGNGVNIRGFGRFNVSDAKVNLAGPGSTEPEYTTIGMTRFRAYDALKKAVRGVVNGKSTTVQEVINQKVAEEVTKQSAPPAPKEPRVEEVVPPPTPPKKPVPTPVRRNPVSKIDWG